MGASLLPECGENRNPCGNNPSSDNDLVS
ncbi:uncharacterized protein METZ01_LOCUS372498, partial [marine metagenome]